MTILQTLLASQSSRVKSVQQPEEMGNGNPDRIDDGFQAAEQLVISLLAKSSRLSLQPASRRSSLPHLPSKKRRIIGKTVSFADNDLSVHYIDETNETNEVCYRWYQKHEYKKIKEENSRTLLAFSKASAQSAMLDETEYCLRGLEKQISVLVFQIPYRNRQKKVVRSVLNLQQIQRSMKRRDSAALREMSLIVSKQDNLLAIKTASMDCC
jgi:hypothetical protein